MSQDRDDGSESGQNANQQGGQSQADQTTRWFATSAARLGLVFIGLVLLLFALGQAVGLNLLGLVADALTSQLGRWLAVAFFAVLLIAIAARWGRSPASG